MNPSATTSTQAPVRTQCFVRESPPAKTSSAAKNESLLIARLKKGDERALAELVKKRHGALIRMAMNYVADREAAEEVVQETWIAVIDGIHRFEGRSSLNTWIYSILIHKGKDRGVRERRHVTFSASEPYRDDDREEAVDPSRFHACRELAGGWALPPQPWDELTPERLLASKQSYQALSGAIDRLQPALRDVLMLKDVDGVDSKEICELLNITESNLYVRLHRARERVREAVEVSMLGNLQQNVSSRSISALMRSAQAIARKPCPTSKKRVDTPVMTW
jgi:RNA polymerase sigma-70 factor, ECF subfamily